MNGVPVLKNSVLYVDGYAWCPNVKSFGPLSTMYDKGDDAPFCNALRGQWLGNCHTNIGTINGIFDNTATTGLHTLGITPALRTISAYFGTTAAAAQGDVAWAGQWLQTDYIATPADLPVAVTMKFSGPGATSTELVYENPWGKVAHALAAATTDNAANGFDDGIGAATSKGGYMVYHVTACNGTANIKIQDSTAAGGAFGDLLTTGVIDLSSPTAGVVALAKNAAVKQYIRWQLAWGTATTVTFALAFVRNYV